jgi:hypothetical protein
MDELIQFLILWFGAFVVQDIADKQRPHERPAISCKEHERTAKSRHVICGYTEADGTRVQISVITERPNKRTK